MLFKLDTKKENIEAIDRVYLKDFGWNERRLQKLLFNNLDRVVREDELLVIQQSRNWQEEPDLMAVDANGDLYIFELKAWESRSANILQVLRYGQIYGQWDYEQLNRLFSQFSEESLIEAHKRQFPEVEMSENDFNKRQRYIVLTNGIDVRTREAILYWGKQGLDINAWVYRIYRPKVGELYFEFNTYKKVDDPTEDIEEGYFILNTNYRNDPNDDKDMITNKKAAAYFNFRKKYIARMQKGDRIFLYRSGTGIVARGIVKGGLKKADYHGNPKYGDEEWYVELKNFIQIQNPLSASDIRSLTGIEYRFRQTCFSMDRVSGDKVWKELTSRI